MGTWVNSAPLYMVLRDANGNIYGANGTPSTLTGLAQLTVCTASKNTASATTNIYLYAKFAEAKVNRVYIEGFYF